MSAINVNTKKKGLAHTVSQRMASPEKRSIITDVLENDKLRGRDLISIDDLSQEEIFLILDLAARLKSSKFDVTQTLFAKGQTLAMLFEKPSLRTRVTFEAGMTQLGGSAIYLEGRLGIRESVPDIARNLDCWIDGIMARTFSHTTVVELADNAKIPVINGLSDLEHPCQALADFQTILELRTDLTSLKTVFIGDGNNVANSFMLLAAKLGVDFTIACPAGYEPNEMIWNKTIEYGQATSALINITEDPLEAVSNADVIYTDTWTSMGQEDEAERRRQVFAPYQVNNHLIKAAKPDAIVMHNLPAHRGEEITDEVIDGPQSVVLIQAENRLHAQKAILSMIL
jgi:ornithine carbamoyltransferase